MFETVVRHAVRLCDADVGLIYRLDGDVYRLATAARRRPRSTASYLAEHPLGSGTGTLVGLVGRDRRTVQIHDAESDPRYLWHEARELGGFRSMLGVPMLADDRVVGVIVLWRDEVDPFDDRTIGLVTTFAAQGAIAIQNVQLFQALQQRSAELARSVDELRALEEVSHAVSSSLALDQEVLQTIVSRAVELSGADGGSIFELDRPAGEFALRTCAGTGADARGRPAADPHPARRDVHRPRGGGRPRAAGARPRRRALRPAPRGAQARRLALADRRAAPPRAGEHRHRSSSAGARPGRSTRRRSTLLETLASHSAVAIHNARVFRELEAKTQELEVASRHKSEFLASMSHELRTPLNAVIGFSDVLLERMFGELNARQEEYVLDIRNSGRHLLDLINEILDLSKIEAGRMELELGAVSLPALLDQGWRWCASARCGTASRSGSTIAPGVGTVRADEVKLLQVVVNLLSNAVKFTPDGGSVDVRAEVSGTDALVTVRDTGHRHPRGGARAHLRGLPARRPRRAHERRGHGPRPHALAADPRPARRPAVDGVRGRRGQHVLVHRAAARRRVSGPPEPRGRRGGAARPAPTRSS